MTLHERSAGVVLIRRQNGDVRYLLLDYDKHWDYSKGHVEAGESDESAALREVHEETGISDLTLLNGFARQIVYFFRDKKKGLIQKTVVFFLGESNAGNVQLSHEHVGHAWLDFEAALERLTFASAKEVLRAAHAFLNGKSGSPAN